jgi:hypothetical protein
VTGLVTGLVKWRLLVRKLASGLRRYSASNFAYVSLPGRPTSFDVQTIPPVPDICLRARRPLVRVKSRHARSDVTRHRHQRRQRHVAPFFLVFSRLPFPEYRRVDSHLDLVPQDRRSCPARTSAPLNGHRTSARLVVRVVEHPVHGREAYRLLSLLRIR